ncbi:MAG: pyridoxamine 5'-phosphate oxidase family protein [Coriobacteriia bacterium]|nr:pyridoxamine 5'-phosphate oxidase family protein [Coriobacteriia bacterium]
MTASEKERLVGIMKATANHAFLGTCDGDRPVVRSVSPIVEDDLSIWVTTFSNASKVKQIGRNPRICLAFATQPTGEKRATVHGRAEVVSDPVTKKRVWGLATFNLSEIFPRGPESEEYGLLRIIPEEIRWHDSWDSEWKVYRPKG